ncbi:MAG: hypothetical protein K2G69_01205, partial [Muribaculaceae bacterium]|nr:hypothetical protein [Muribaculaceae bacterium]
IQFSTPAMAATRADKLNVTADEAKIKSLWLYIFDENGNYYKAINCSNKLNASLNGSLPQDETYATLFGNGSDGLAIAGGKYKFYMVANLDGMLPSSGTNIYSETTTFTDTQLKAVELNFGTNASTLTAKTMELPMAANCTDVTVKKNNSDKEDNVSIVDANGVVNIKNGTYNISIDMSFLCSAVRYTILFDNTKEDAENNVEAGASQFFNGFEVASSNPVQVKNLLTAYTIYSTAQAVTTAGNYVSLSGGEKYTFTGSMDDVIDGTDAGALTKADWTDANTKRAYRGVVYLPENYGFGTNNALKTTLKLSYTLGTDPAGTTISSTPELILPNTTGTSADSELGNVLARAHYYDVYGKITSSGMQFFVKVNPWKTHATQVEPF